MFFQNFERFSEADNFVESLRELIIDQAIRGRLSKQNPGEMAPDVPALKASKIAFPLPRNWKWVRLGDLAHLITSGSRDWAKYYSEDGAKFLTMGNLSRGSYKLRLEKMRYVNPPISGEGTRTKLHAHDLLISITGDVGNLGLIPDGFGDAYINQHSCLLRLLQEFKGRYIAEFLRSSHAKIQFNEPQRGIKNSFRLSDVAEIEVPLPPVPEQQRIVAKIDELMAVCDRLESQQRERDTRHAALARAALARFAAAPTADNLQYLFHPAYDISPEDLRKAVLLLAMKGALVPQVAEEENVGELVSRIREKRRDVGTSGARGRSSALGNPFSLPTSWEWAGATEVVEVFSDRGRKIKTKDAKETGRYPVIDQGKQFIRGYCDDEQCVIRISSPIIIFGDHTKEIKIVDFDFVVGADGVKLLRPVEINPMFYYLALQWLPLDDRGYGRHFKLLRSAVIPIPPLAEQGRIVAKVNQLLSIIDSYKSQLAIARDSAARLLDALVSEFTGAVRRTAAAPVAPASDSKDGGIQPAEPQDTLDDDAETPTGATKFAPPNRQSPLNGGRSSAPQEDILARLRDRGSLSSSEAQAATGLDSATLRCLFKTLIDRGLVRTEGQRRGMRYLLTAKAAHAE